MPTLKRIEVKQEVTELKRLYRKAAPHLKPRIKMLMIAREEGVYSQGKLAQRLKVDANSAKTWKRAYESGGLDSLLQDSGTGNNPSVIDAKTHEALRAKLTTPTEAPRSYKELQDWLSEHHISGINYQTLRGYVQRHFGTKLKVVRKSPIRKDKEAVEGFKNKSPRK
ncbi:MAG: helix-turn-helix domain-containing protein [Flavisolibacter sp.]|nr:helix-turn-helix domain-containing protein [Flavisolibacter sp.]